MKNHKLFKIFSKTLFFAIIYLGLVTLISNKPIDFLIVLSAFLGIATTFVNVFEYEKLSNLPADEFLESTHQIILDSKIDFQIISDTLKKLLIFYQVSESSNKLVFISGKNIFSKQIVLTIEDEVLILKISYNSFLKWFPDFTSNYKTLKILVEQLKLKLPTANTGQ
jgi:hypothetical protein